MSKAVKVWLITAISLVLIGGLLFGGVMMALKWNFSGLGGDRLLENEHSVTERYESIAVNIRTTSLCLLPVEGEETTVICHEKSKTYHSVKVEDGVLHIELVDTRRWYERLFDFGRASVTVLLPTGEYERLTVKASTGDIDIPAGLSFAEADISVSTGSVTFAAETEGELTVGASTGDVSVKACGVGALSVSVSTGDICLEEVDARGDITLHVTTGDTRLARVRCQGLVSSGDTGDLRMEDTLAAGAFALQRTTGSIKLAGCDAAEIYISTDTGSVTGSLLSEKVFIVSTSSGKKDVPKTVTGGRCEITTSTGDVRIVIEQ